MYRFTSNTHVYFPYDNFGADGWKVALVPFQSGSLFTATPSKRHTKISSSAETMMDGLEEEVLETGWEDEEVVPKRGAVSVVWRFFCLQKSDVNQTTIYCKCCGAKAVVGGGGNTSNLPHHLNRKHVMEHQECVRLRSASMTSSDANEMVKPKLSWGAAWRLVCLGDETQTLEGDFEIQ